MYISKYAWQHQVIPAIKVGILAAIAMFFIGFQELARAAVESGDPGNPAFGLFFILLLFAAPSVGLMAGLVFLIVESNIYHLGRLIRIWRDSRYHND